MQDRDVALQDDGDEQGREEGVEDVKVGVVGHLYWDEAVPALPLEGLREDGAPREDLLEAAALQRPCLVQKADPRLGP